MPKYDSYNREERNICAHLFRLLHEKLYEADSSPLSMLLNKLSNKSLDIRNRKNGLANLAYSNIGIYSEVAIIRDAYFERKSSVNGFMDELTRLIMRQENVSDCRLYSQLPDVLNTPSKTHPKQIRQKAISEGIALTEEENRVFGAMQAMFNAKPDLAITIDNSLLVFEAKFTEPFDNVQLMRTWNIAEVWATLLYKDFGFTEPPEYSVIKLGAGRFDPEISWSDILEIAEIIYNACDRSLLVFRAGLELLAKNL